MKDPVAPWLKEFLFPMLDACWAGDVAAARRAYEAALATLPAEPDPDLRQCKWMKLSTPWMGVLMENGHAEEGLQVVAELLASWSAPQPGPDSTAAAIATELMARFYLDRGGWVPLHDSEARRLIETMPEEQRGGSFWSEVGIWAFKHGERDLLLRAVSHFGNEPPAKNEDWLYHSTLMLYRLLEEVALGEDFERLAELIDGPAKLRELQQFILPESRRQGIVTPRAEVLLTEKQQAYAA